MLIRSQDKKVLIDMNGLTIKVVTEEPFQHEPIDPHIEAYGTNSGDFSEILGAYSSEEKAIKVLDMVQTAYEKYEYEKVFKTGLRLFETFQMPEDEEVEA